MRPAAFVVGALGVAVALFAVLPRGPALSGDSAVYLSVAESLAHGRGFVQFDGAPYTRWAPLLPVLLATARPGIDAAWIGVGLNLLALFIVLALAAGWLSRHVASRWIRAGALAVLLVSATLLEATVFVWSDLPFVALALAALIGADRLPTAGADGRRRLALAGGGLVALAILVRYAGLALVPVGIALFFVPDGRTSALRRGVDASVFAAVALLPIAFWCARNLALVGGMFGPRHPVVAQPLAQATDLLAAFGVWIVGSGRGEETRIAAGVGAVVIVGLTFVLARRLASRGEAPAPASVHAAAGFAFAASLMLVGWSSYSSIERLNERYTIPLVVPGVLVLAWSADRLRARFAHRRVARPIFALAAVLAVATLGLGAVRFARHVERYRGPGEWGFNTERWDRSANDGLLSGIALLPPRVTVFSNAPEAIYARLRRPARGLEVPAGGVRGPAVVVEFSDAPGARPGALDQFRSGAEPCSVHLNAEIPEGRVFQLGCPP